MIGCYSNPLNSLPTNKLNYKTMGDKEIEIKCLFRQPEIVRRALLETERKHLESEQIEERIDQLRNVWPKLRNRLQNHLLPNHKT